MARLVKRKEDGSSIKSEIHTATVKRNKKIRTYKYLAIVSMIINICFLIKEWY
jgi:hypothetical protein